MTAPTEGEEEQWLAIEIMRKPVDAEHSAAPKLYVEETPQWMVDMAAKIAANFTAENEFGKRARLQAAVLDAMKDAGREVALYFAANPKG